MKRFFLCFFISIGLFFGLIFCVVVPPFQAPDEFNHFYRSWQITEGGLWGEKTADNRLGGTVPVALLTISRPFQSLPFQPENKVKFDTILRLLSYPVEDNNLIFIDFSNTAIYAPTAYMPQIVAISIGKFLKIPPLSIFYLSRVFTLIFWLSIVYLSLKIVPQQFLWLFVFLALLPSSLFINASSSADVVTNALSFLAMAIFLSLMVEDSEFVFDTEVRGVPTELHRVFDKVWGSFSKAKNDGVTLSKNDGVTLSHPVIGSSSRSKNLQFRIILLFASTLLIALNKLAYAPLCLLILLSKQENFGGIKNKTLISACFIFSNMAIVAWWASVVSPLQLSYANYHPIFRVGQQLNEGVDAWAQLQFILHNPLIFSKIALISLLKTAPSTLIHFVGKFGWEKNYLPILLILPLFLGLILRGVNFRFRHEIRWKNYQNFPNVGQNVSEKGLNRQQKLSIFAVASLTTLFLTTTLYLIWCPVGSPFVENLAGKYFIPIAPLFFLALPDCSKKIKSFQDLKLLKKFDFGYSILLIISLLWSVGQVINRYYF